MAIVGDGELKNRFIEKIAELELEKNIKMYGFLENPYGLIKNSKVLCMPSKWEGFGLAAVEALSLSIPVVCSGCGGLKNLIDDSCGCICGYDTQKYAAEITKILLNKEYQEKKKENALKRARALSNIDSYTNMIKGIYQNVLS